MGRLLNFSGALSALCVASAFAPGLASAGPFTGQVYASFSDPVTSGYIIPSGGGATPFNNSGSAVVDICNGTCAAFGNNPLISQISWGNTDNNPSSPTFGQAPSRIAFIGNFLTNVPADTSVALGTVLYQNLTSALESLIFGAKMTISIPGVDLLGVSLNIVTTANGGISQTADADFVSFSGLGNSLSLGAFEGGTVFATLFGKIVGDPQLFLTDIQSFGDGLVGPAPSPTPIPGALPLFASGLGMLGFVVHRRKRKQTVAA
jgi:hypothetical protein